MTPVDDAEKCKDHGHAGSGKELGVMARGWQVNITPAERIARIVVGGLGALAGFVLLASASGVLAVVLELLLVVAGLDLVVTGALGHCPLYARLEHVPASLKEKTS